MLHFLAKLVLAAALFAGLAFPSSRAEAQIYKVDTAQAPAPQELAASIRETLVAEALRVTGPQGPICEIWLRKAVPANASPNQNLGIAYGQLSEGTLLGAIRFLAAAKDFRQQQIKPGVYTLRYMLQPVDGNHQGVSPNRDYLLLSPAATDSSPAAVATEALLIMSRKASGTGHPSVWNLTAADNPSGTVPGLAHVEDGDLWVLYFHAPLAAPGSPVSPLTMALVLVGHAAES